MSTNYGLGLLGAFGTLTEESRKIAVWAKGRVIAGYDASIWRHDDFGFVIRFSDYGDRNSEYGWEIDHIIASALSGPDNITNLRPLHHRKNASLGGTLGGLLNR